MNECVQVNPVTIINSFDKVIEKADLPKDNKSTRGQKPLHNFGNFRNHGYFVNLDIEI